MGFCHGKEQSKEDGEEQDAWGTGNWDCCSYWIREKEIRRPQVLSCSTGRCHLDLRHQGQVKQATGSGQFCCLLCHSPPSCSKTFIFILNPWKVLLMFASCCRHAFAMFEWSVLPACSHLASWLWKKDTQQQGYSLKNDALLWKFWSRDTIWNWAPVLKQRLNCQGGVELFVWQNTVGKVV